MIHVHQVHNDLENLHLLLMLQLLALLVAGTWLGGRGAGGPGEESKG